MSDDSGCKYEPPGMTSLYIMVFICLLDTCSIDSDFRSVKSDLEQIKQSVGIVEVK